MSHDERTWEEFGKSEYQTKLSMAALYSATASRLKPKGSNSTPPKKKRKKKK